MKHVGLILLVLMFGFTLCPNFSIAHLELLDLPILPSFPSLPKTCPVSSNSKSCDPSGRKWKSFPTCSSTPENIVTGRPLRGSLSQENGEFPSWMNVTLARQGQRFFANNKFSLLLGSAYGLIGVLVVPDIRQVLLFTHNSDTPKKVVKRYLSTIVQTMVWLEDLLETRQTDNAFLTSIRNVREVHRSAARNASAKAPNVNGLDLRQYDTYSTDDKFWNAFHADLVASNISSSYRKLSKSYFHFGRNPQPVSQFAQSLTLFGFMGYPIITPSAYGLEHVCEEDWMAWLHLWAIIGHGIGIKDEYNIALQPTYSAAISYLNEVKNLYYIPFFFNIDHGSKVLIETLFQGIDVTPLLIVPGLDMRSFMGRFVKDHFHIEIPNITRILDPIQLAADCTWYSAVVPGLRIPGANAAAGIALDSATQTAILALFGPYFTNMQKAKHVYFY